MVYPALAAVAGALAAIVYGIKRKLNRQQSSGSEAESSADKSTTRKEHPTERSVGKQSEDLSPTQSATGSANDPSTDYRRKTDSGTIPTDVTSQGRVHSLILSDVKDDGTGVGRFHGLVILVRPFTDANTTHQTGDKVKVRVTDVANKYATAIPLEKL